MTTVIKLFLQRISSDKAQVRLTDVSGVSNSYEFNLPWLDEKDQKTIFWSLELNSQDSRTWPKHPKDTEIISRAEELGLFLDGYPKSQRLRIIGNNLFEAVFGSEEIKSTFSTLLQKTDTGIPIVELHLLSEDHLLQSYPWELLHDGEDFLFDSQRAALVRSIDQFDQPIPVVNLKKSLKILLIDPRPQMPSEYRTFSLLDRPYLLGLSDQTLGKVIVEDLALIQQSGSTLTKLSRYFENKQDYAQILHIDTLLEFAWQCYECGVLNPANYSACPNCMSIRFETQELVGSFALQKENDKLMWVSGEELGKRLRDKEIQIVILSGCKADALKSPSVFHHMANTLIRHGVPAVIAVQFSTDGNTTQAFIEDFYTSLVIGRSLVETLTEVRANLLTTSDAFWYRPVLYLRTDENNYYGNVFVSELTEAERSMLFSEAKQVLTNVEIEVPYGTMPPDSRFYVERSADKECMEHLSRPYAATLFVQAPRQMGKSSLIRKVTAWAEDFLDKKTVFIDFQRFPEPYFEDEKSFLIELCWMISDALGIPEKIDYYWSTPHANIMKCNLYLSEYILPQIEKPFILAMDEVERMFTSNFRSDFFSMLRTWHNDRVYDNNFAKMSLILSSSTEPYLFIVNPNRSPFNVADLIELQDFTEEEVAELNQRHNSPLTQTQINDLMDLLGGHPYLTRQILYLLTTKKIDMKTLLAQATEDNGPFGDHLRHYLFQISRRLELKEALTEICRNLFYPENQIYYRLEGAGLIKRDGHQVVFRNKLYDLYFKKRLT